MQPQRKPLGTLAILHDACEGEQRQRLFLSEPERQARNGRTASVAGRRVCVLRPAALAVRLVGPGGCDRARRWSAARDGRCREVELRLRDLTGANANVLRLRLAVEL